jgi:di/tripeptidase
MTEAISQEDQVLHRVRRLPPSLEGFREMLLANLIMIGEIPAPTYAESQRIEFLKQRFTECGLSNCSTDDVGNGLAVLPGSGERRRSVLLTAHADTPFSSTVPHTLTVDTQRITGPAVADNSLGLAVLATLPSILEQLDIRLRSDIVLMGATRSLGRGDLAGLRFFLENNHLPITAGISVEGAQLGRLHYASLASLGGEIRCTVRQESDAEEGSQPSAIAELTEVIDRIRALPLPEVPDPIRALPLPEVPDTTLVLGAVEGGTSYKTPAKSALLRFQLRSEAGKVLADLEQRIEGIVEEVSLDSGAEIRFEVIARTNAGGIPADHPLVIQTRRIMASLGIQPRSDRFSSTVSSFIEHHVPSITLGISKAHNLSQCDESVEIEPMLKGVAQLIGVLLTIDGDCCDGH